MPAFLRTWSSMTQGLVISSFLSMAPLVMVNLIVMIFQNIVFQDTPFLSGVQM